MTAGYLPVTHPGTYVEPSDETIHHIMGYDGGLTLEELFVEWRHDTEHGDELLAHLMDVARLRIVTVFSHASGEIYARMKMGHKWGTRATFFVPGDRGTIDELVRYVAENMKGTSEFVRVRDLPPAYRLLVKAWRDTVRARARGLLLEAVVSQLVQEERQLWHHAGDRIWQASQSLIDEYEPLRRKVRSLPAPRHRVKRDDHSYHGRPKRDRKNGTIEGVSTGQSRL